MDFIKKNGAGLLLCLCIAIPAWLLGQAVPVVGGPVFSILIGMVLTLFWKDKTKVQPGIGFTSKKVLQYAVILLGFGLNLSEIAKVGAQSLPNPFRQLPGRRLIRDIHGLKGSQTPQHLPCGFPLSSKAQQKYLFPPYPGINFLYHSPSPRLLCFLCTPFPDKFFPGFRHQIAAVKISGKLIFLCLIPLIQACFFIMFK